MSKARQHPLLVFLVHMTQSILLRQIVYLKAENEILRSRLMELAERGEKASYLLRDGDAKFTGFCAIITTRLPEIRTQSSNLSMFYTLDVK